MTRFRSLTTGLVVAGLLAGGAAFAQGPRDGGPAAQGGRAGARGSMRGPGVMLRGLNLTDAQQQQVRDIRERYREGVQQAQQRVREAMAAQRAAVDAVPLNEGAIRAATFVLAEAQTEAAIQQARIGSEIWAVLSDAQREHVNARRAERQARVEQRANRQRQGR